MRDGGSPSSDTTVGRRSVLAGPRRHRAVHPFDPIPFTVSPPLNAYLEQLKTAGWSLREAYYRNWVIWRQNGGNPRGLIVFPAERSVASAEDFTLFIAVETLRCGG